MQEMCGVAKQDEEEMSLKDYTVEELISRLCYLWSKTTKTARAEEKRIAKELEKRGVVDKETLLKELDD